MMLTSERNFPNREIGIFRKFAALAALLILGLLSGCGHSGGNGGLQAIKISPSSSLIPLAGARQLKATGIYGDGSTQDLTTFVNWTSSDPSVTVDTSGIATGANLGSSDITATLGSVLGLTQFYVNTNGFQANTMGILFVPFNKSEVDAGFLAQNQTKDVDGAYSVQEVNLDGDKFSNTLPVTSSLIISIPVPKGFVPNFTVASPVSSRVAVFSYSSAQVQIINASYLAGDFTNNTVIATYTAPITKTVTFNGKTCMICAAVVNPTGKVNPATGVVTNDQVLLSTAQGYYAMDLSTGTFAALPLTPTAYPAEQFVLNPLATDPYILSPTYGQTGSVASEVQVLDLKTNQVTTHSDFGLNIASAAGLDLDINAAIIVDGAASNQALLINPLEASPDFLVKNIPTCPASPGPLSMVAIGLGVAPLQAGVAHMPFFSQPSGSCIGIEIWPTPGQGSLDPNNVIQYGYAALPDIADVPAVPPIPPTVLGTPAIPGEPFRNGSDPNTIATFTSVFDKKTYGILVSADQVFIAKIDLSNLTSAGLVNGTNFLGTGGLDITPIVRIDVAGYNVAYLPAIQ